MCIKFLADGMPTEDIAHALNVANRTVVAMANKHADEITTLEKLDDPKKDEPATKPSIL